MPIRLFKRTMTLARRIAACGGLFAIGMARLPAQIATIGGLTATVVDDHGDPLGDVTVSLEHGGTVVRALTTSRSGVVSAPVLTPGRYALLVEQFGYQPVRMRDIDVVGGGVSHVTVRLVRRPPPIAAIEEQPSNATISGTTGGRFVDGRELGSFDMQHDISGVTEAFGEADPPRDGRHGALASGNGLRPAFSSLQVDGVNETLLRHPGLPDEPATSPLFARDGVDRVTFTEFSTDEPGPGTLGSILGAETSRGGDRFTFRPWATFSGAKFGGRSIDNSGDSSAMSVQAGVAMGGAIKADTASWFLRADYQRLQQPSASPFDAGRATVDSVADLLASFRGAAQTLGHQDVNAWLAPTVRTWTGGSGSGRVDWRFGPGTLLAIRAGGASWTETNPQVGNELVNGSGVQLKATDFSGAAELTAGGNNLTSETRIGLRSATRDWTGAVLPFTSLVGDAIAVGGAGTLPGRFSETGVTLSETANYRFADHTLQAGLALEHRSVLYDWVPGSAGRFEFGDLASFSAGDGAFYQAIRGVAPPTLGVSDISFVMADAWRATPQIQLLAGIRNDNETLPQGVVALNVRYLSVSGISNSTVPVDLKSRNITLNGGFEWDVSGSGQTVIRGTLGTVPGQYDLAALAEAAQFDGDVTIRRAAGAVTWPQVGASAGASAGEALTLFAPSVRKPKAFKADLSLTHRLAAGTTLTLAGGYRHGNYLLQRNDLNLIGAPVAVTSEGRPVFGALQQYGSLITPAVESNRRFAEFDAVYELTSTGYDDYYEASLTLNRHVGRGLDIAIGYTYSRNTDNLPGQLSADPADQLTPFPAGLNGNRWENGTSDLDIPQRAVATLTYTTPGHSPVTFAARYRYRSGLPFTPGFRTGVDANGDGSGGNDPAFIGASIAGMPALSSANGCLASQVGQFVARNSCRDAAVQALDLRASFGIGHGWAVTVDGFNLVGTTTGLFDHAAVLVDPKGTITVDSTGHPVLPLIANPGFGQLLSRRGDPRTLRIGFRVENW